MLEGVKNVSNSCNKIKWNGSQLPKAVLQGYFLFISEKSVFGAHILRLNSEVKRAVIVVLQCSF